MKKADKSKLSYIGRKPGGTDDRDSDSWFTPRAYLEMVRSALGGTIDFDPFSSVEAQRTVRARLYHTIADNSLTTPWPMVRTVFMNPPYSRGLMAAATDAFLGAFDAGLFQRGIVLCNNATDTTWWQRLTDHDGCVSVALTHGRIAFENVDGKHVSGNTRGQAFILFQNGKRQEQLDARRQFSRYFDNPLVARVWS